MNVKNTQIQVFPVWKKLHFLPNKSAFPPTLTQQHSTRTEDENVRLHLSEGRKEEG